MVIVEGQEGNKKNKNKNKQELNTIKNKKKTGQLMTKKEERREIEIDRYIGR